MTYRYRSVSIVLIAIALVSPAVSALAQSNPAAPLITPAESPISADGANQTREATAPPATPAPNYKTARDAFLKTKKFKTPAEQVSRAKEFLTALSASASNKLTALKERLTATDMPANQKEKAMTEIDKTIDAFTALNAQITDAATRSDLAKISIRMKNALQAARFTLKRQVIALKLQRLGGVVQRLETALELTETKLNDLKISGVDTAAAAAALANLKNKLSTIRTSQRNADAAIDGTSIDKDFEATTNSADSVAAKIALTLRTILNATGSLIADVKSLTPPTAEPSNNP